jgi:tetratricopeptide (TPR) repeat protein
MAPEDATTLGSQLLAGGAYERAFPYLVRGLQGRPSVFGWCRLGKLCRDAGRIDDAVRCYDEALVLAPGDRYAVIGRAAALAESAGSSLAQLVEAIGQLAQLLDSGDRAPVAWTAYAVMRAVCRRYPHPLLRQRADALKAIARALDQRSDSDRRQELERRLDAILRVQELLGDQAGGPQTAAVAARRTVKLEASRGPRLLTAGTDTAVS